MQCPDFYLPNLPKMLLPNNLYMDFWIVRFHSVTSCYVNIATYGTKESFYIRKRFNYNQTGLGHQHGHHFFTNMADIMSYVNAVLVEIQKEIIDSRYTSAKFLLMWFMVFSLFWLLLNVLDNDNNYLNVTHLLGYFQKVTWFVICCLYLQLLF